MKVAYKLVFLTLLTRLGIGMVVISVVASMLNWNGLDEYIVAFAALIVTGSGLAMSLLHVGRPARIMNAFANRKSMMSWEALITPPLVAVMAAYALFAYLSPAANWLWVLRAGVVTLGIAFVYVSGKVYHLRARPSWTTTLLLYEYFVSAICLGLLGFTALAALTGFITPGAAQVIGSLLLALLIVEGIITYAYRSRAIRTTGTAAKALEKPVTKRLYGWFVVIGLVVPALLALVVVLGVSATAAAPLALAAFLLGAVWWRVLFIRSATLIKLTPDIVV